MTDSEEYAAIQSQYKLAAKHVRDIIELQTKSFKVHDISYRAKSIESFAGKCKKTQADGTLKYDDPIRQVTDLAGVRLICFLKKDVDPICESIIRVFDSDDVEDVGERVFQKGRFGYQSKHILVRLPKETYLPNCNLVDHVVCEIQVRTLLQHAWAEIEHDIQYKGNFVPDHLRKRFAALAGLLEIADGEFERIQRDNDKLIEDIKDGLVSKLTEEALDDQDSEKPSEIKSSAKIGVRNLVAQGRYEEALDFYNERLSLPSPTYTLYIGRAKVKFLLGNTESALKDLERAEEIQPSDYAIDNLRRLINDGNSDLINTSAEPSFTADEIATVFQLMLEGKGKEAFALISDLEEKGYNRAFAFINKAASCLLELDVSGAQEYLSRLRTNIGTPMSVNIHILKYVRALICSENVNEELNELMIVTSAVPQFRMSLSPLLNFLSGLKLKHRKLFNLIQRDFKDIPQLNLPSR